MDLDANQTLLVGIRGLRSFSAQCDLDAVALASADPFALFEKLLAGNHVDKDELGRFWAARQKFAYVDPFATVITEAAIGRLPGEIAIQKLVLPLYELGGALTLVMATPEDSSLVNQLSKIVKMPVSASFAFPKDIEALTKVHYSTEAGLVDSFQTADAEFDIPAGEDFTASSTRLARMAESEQVIKLLDSLILFALRCDASDIHIEPQADEVVIRYRIDGNLREVLKVTRKLHPFLLTRIKFITEQNITETRLPTDGRYTFTLGSKGFDLRISTIPSQYGEKAVLRILGGVNRQSLLKLDNMLISATVLTRLRRVMANPSGIIFVTGPTGSGKTTTLYAALNELNERDVNISTVEDPVEVKLPGITQTQINPIVGLDFARMLRSLLRQDPDIMLVGEIRDQETAKIATEAALTGHLVLTTLHTNSAPEAFVRLEEMGIAPYLVAPSVVAVVGQRLASRICEHCKVAYIPEPAVTQRLFNDEHLPTVTFYRGKGCHVCNHTGFKGRVAFHEIVVVNREMRAKIVEGASQAELIKAAWKTGYRPLRYDGLKKVLLGLTTIEEVDKQTSVEFVS